jgi:hypothetical protein
MFFDTAKQKTSATAILRKTVICEMQISPFLFESLLAKSLEAAHFASCPRDGLRLSRLTRT